MRKSGYKLTSNVGDYINQRMQLEDNGCVVWTGHTNRLGYGIVIIAAHKKARVPRQRYAHRVVYEMWRGPIPAGLVLDHLCRRPSCVNPDHLEVVTQAVNVARGLHGGGRPRPDRRLSTTCSKGHDTTGYNRIVTSKQQLCRECARMRKKRYLLRVKAKGGAK